MEDITNRLDGIQVFILVHVKIVKGVSVSWVSIAESEVNGNAKLDFTSTEDVLKE